MHSTTGDPNGEPCPTCRGRQRGWLVRRGVCVLINHIASLRPSPLEGFCLCLITQKEIDLHLYNLWNGNRSTRHRKPYEEIYRSGTKYLRNLNPSLRRSIQCEVTVLGDHEDLLRSGTPRTLRSVSRNIGLDNGRYFKRESTIPTDFGSINSPLSGKRGLRLLRGSPSFEGTPQANQVSPRARKFDCLITKLQ